MDKCSKNRESEHVFLVVKLCMTLPSELFSESICEMVTIVEVIMMSSHQCCLHSIINLLHSVIPHISFELTFDFMTLSFL